MNIHVPLELVQLSMGFFVVCVVLVISVFIVIALIKFIKLINNVNALVQSNRENIDKTLNLLPEISSNVNECAIGVKETVHLAESTIGTFVGSDDSQETNSFNNIYDIIRVAGDVVRVVMSFFSDSKKG